MMGCYYVYMYVQYRMILEKLGGWVAFMLLYLIFVKKKGFLGDVMMTLL